MSRKTQHNAKAQPKAVLKVQEAAERLGLPVARVFELIEGGDLAAINVGSGSCSRNFWRILVTSLEKFQKRSSNSKM